MSWMHAEQLRQVKNREPFGGMADDSHNLRRQSSPPVVFAPPVVFPDTERVSNPAAHHVMRLFASCRPFQIADAVIGSVTVNVIYRVVARRARADERFG